MSKFLRLLPCLAVLALTACGGGAKHPGPAQTQPRAHPPGFGVPPKGYHAVPRLSGVPQKEMFDTVTVGTVPSYAQAVAGYVGGSWPTYLPLVSAFPHAAHVSIAVNASQRARILDVEPGDASPSQVVGWYYADKAAGFSKPGFYAALFNGMGEVKARLAGAGIPRSSYFLWDADWTYGAHVDAGFDATQWTDRSLGRNLDESSATLDFLQVKPPPPPDPYHYRALSKVTQNYHSKSGILRMNELSITLQYDFNRARHSFRYARLRRLQYLERVLANRVWTLGHNGHWGVANRGVRYSVLRPRADGKKIAK